MIEVPHFDVEALRQAGDFTIPDDVERANQLWRAMTADLIAAADHIELLEAALLQARHAAWTAS